MLDAVAHKAERVLFFIVFSDIIALENGRVSMKSTAGQEFLKTT